MRWLIVVIATCFVLGSTFHTGMKYQAALDKAEGYDALAKSTQQIVDVFHDLAEQTSELQAIKVNPPAGPNVQLSFDILRRNLQTRGIDNTPSIYSKGSGQ